MTEGTQRRFLLTFIYVYIFTVLKLLASLFLLMRACIGRNPTNLLFCLVDKRVFWLGIRDVMIFTLPFAILASIAVDWGEALRLRDRALVIQLLSVLGVLCTVLL